MARIRRDPEGSFFVKVRFSDGSVLVVRDSIDRDTAYTVFNEYINGIGALVGTTKEVTITEGESLGDSSMVEKWKF